MLGRLVTFDVSYKEMVIIAIGNLDDFSQRTKREKNEETELLRKLKRNHVKDK